MTDIFTSGKIDRSIRIVTGLVIFTLVLFSVSIAKSQEKEEDYQVIVLCYHHFVSGEPANDSEMQADLFYQQMVHLKEAGYDVISAEEFLSYWQKGYFPEKSVLLTFDDGYESFFHHAYPVLKKFDYPAMVFPIISNMDGLQRRMVYSERLSFHQMRLMQQESGLLTFGSHSYDLHYYREEDNMPAVIRGSEEKIDDYICRVRSDIRLSKKIMEAQLDQDIHYLAWPYGVNTEIAQKEAVDAGMKMIFFLGQRPFTPQDCLEEIPRFLPPHDSLEKFKEMFP